MSAMRKPEFKALLVSERDLVATAERVARTATLFDRAFEKVTDLNEDLFEVEQAIQTGEVSRAAGVANFESLFSRYDHAKAESEAWRTVLDHELAILEVHLKRVQEWRAALKK
jgi:hypothetical protein